MLKPLSSLLHKTGKWCESGQDRRNIVPDVAYEFSAFLSGTGGKTEPVCHRRS